MQVPVWLVVGVAALVIAFGGYRIFLAFKMPAPADSESEANESTPASRPRAAQPRFLMGGMYRMSPRAHLFIGTVYVLLGAALLATLFGWKPL